MIDEKFIVIAVLLNLIGSGSYVIDTIKGRARPHRVTWSLWALISGIIFVAMLSEGADTTALIMTFTITAGPLAILLASFVNKKTKWEIESFDWFCGFLALCGIAAWLLTGEGNVAIAFNILADFFALLPTFIKAVRVPDTESWLVYLNAGLSSLITLLTLDSLIFASYSYAGWIMLSSLIMFVIVKFQLGPKLMNSEAARQ